MTLALTLRPPPCQTCGRGGRDLDREICAERIQGRESEPRRMPEVDLRQRRRRRATLTRGSKSIETLQCRSTQEGGKGVVCDGKVVRDRRYEILTAPPVRLPKTKRSQ